MLLLGESSVGVLAVVCPEYVGVTISMTRLAESLQRAYGVPGKEQFTAAVDLAQTIVRTTLFLPSKISELVLLIVLHSM